MKITRRLSIIIIVIAAGILISFLLVKTAPKPQQRPHSDNMPLVSIMPAQSKSMTMSVEAFGSVQAKKELTETAEVSGKITFISPALDEGRFFQKDGLLMEIDPRNYQLRVEQIKARIEQHKADLLRIEQEQKNAESNRQLAVEELDVATRDWERQKNLRETRVASDSTVDAARLKYLQSKIKNQAIENTIALLTPQRIMAEAQLRSAEVDLQDAELNLSKTKIKAPFSGRTARRFVEQGQFVTVGTPLVKIYDTSAVEVTVQIPLEDMPWLELKGYLGVIEDQVIDGSDNQPIIAYAYLEQGDKTFTWKGAVSRLAGIVEQSTRTAPIIVEFPDPLKSDASVDNPPLVPGMFVRVELVGRQYDKVFEFPRNAIRPDDNVYVINDNVLHIRPVTILRMVGNKVYIEQGIEAGDSIVVSPLEAVTDGMKVRVVKKNEN